MAAVESQSPQAEAVAAVRRRLLAKETVLRRDVLIAVDEALAATRGEPRGPETPVGRLLAWRQTQLAANRERQAQITQEISEIVGGANALADAK